MSLADTIKGALVPTIAMLTREFGTYVTVRRQQTTLATDGSTTLVDTKAPGFSDPISMIITPIDRARAQRDWGRETEVTCVGLIADSIVIEDTFRLTVEAGPLLGNVYAIESTKPEPTGGIVQLGLKKVA